MDLKIVWLNDKMFDVFTGKGWDNWSRFRKEDGNKLKLIKGSPLSKQDFTKLLIHFNLIKGIA